MALLRERYRLQPVFHQVAEKALIGNEHLWITGMA
jgi:hypothetical protein